MKLQYLGHSAFRIISEMGTTIVTDPFSEKMVGFAMTPVRCDAVTVSHHHGDHDCMDGILGNPAVLDVEGYCTADDIAVESISSYHDDVKGAKRGKNLVFTFVVDGLRLVHMGDIGCFDPNVVAKIRHCDVLMIPVGGTFTVDALGAKQYVDAVQPKLVIPMHFRSAEHNFNVDGVDKFLALFEPSAVTDTGADTLCLEDAPQNSAPQVVVLSRFRD